MTPTEFYKQMSDLPYKELKEENAKLRAALDVARIELRKTYRLCLDSYNDDYTGPIEEPTMKSIDSALSKIAEIMEGK